MALADGIAKEMVMEIKRKEIADRVALSVAENGRQPGLLRIILTAAVRFLAEYIRKIQMPPKPKLKIDIEEFRQMQTVKEKLDEQISLIRHTEYVELPKLEENLQDIKGLFKGKEKKEAQDKIDQCKKRLSGQKDQLKKIVRESGYVTVKSFMENYDRAYGIVSEYQRELRRWEQQTGNGKKDMKQETVRQKESIRAKLKKNVQLVKEREQGKKVVRKKDRGGR